MGQVEKFSESRGTMLTFGCRFAITAFLGAGLLGLAGCADTGKAWTKAGVDTSQRAADYNDCLDQAHQQTQREYAIDTDIMASQGNSWRNQNANNFQYQRIITNDGNKSTQIMNACMIGKGYAQAS